VQPRHHQLGGLRFGLEHAEVGDHVLRSAAEQAEPLALARPAAVADRGDEVHGVDERARRLAHDHDHLAAARGDLGRAAGARQPHLRVVVVVADDGRVDVREAVDLGGAEEADVDAARLHPVVEDLGDADHGVGGLGQDAVADRHRQPRRLGADRARLIDQHEPRCMRPARQVRRRARQADADEARAVVLQHPRGGDAHHLVRRVVVAGHSASIHRWNASRSLLIASHSRYATLSRS
jgi:hypothetical protein